MHELFDELAEAADGYADMIAEPITTLVGAADGTIRSISQATPQAPYHTGIAYGTAHATGC